MVITPAKHHSRNLIDFFNSLDEELNTCTAHNPPARDTADAVYAVLQGLPISRLT